MNTFTPATLPSLQTTGVSVPSKPGWRTTEFWLTLAGAAVAFIPGAVPPQYSGIVAAVLGGLYTAGRSAIKAKQAQAELPPTL